MHILHTECSMHWGGQELRTVLEHNWLNARGHVSYLACRAGSEMMRRAESLGAVNVAAFDFAKTWRADVALAVWRFCRAHGIDVIHSHGGRDSALALVAFWRGVPLVRSRHITNPVRRALSYQKLCAHVVAAAAVIKHELVKIGVEQERISVIGEGVDLHAFSPGARPQKLADEFGLRAQETAVVNIGMIRGDKGQQFYFDAAAEILARRDDIKFFLIGEGTGARELEHSLREQVRARKLGGRFIMTGYRNDIADWIRLADFAVIASTATEAQSRVAPQAFAGGKTVIAARTGGLPEVVRDGVTGLLVPPGDARALRDAIETLADDKTLRDNLAANAHQFAREQLSFETMMQKTLAVYAQVTRAGNCPR